MIETKTIYKNRSHLKFSNFLLVFSLCVFFASLTASTILYHNGSSFYEEKQAIPELLVEPRTLDFGSVSQGEYVETVILSNVSKEPLDILFVIKSCSCTEVSVPKGELSAGNNVEMKCHINTKGKKRRVKDNIAVAYKMYSQKDNLPRYVTVDIHADVHDSSEQY